MNKCDLSVIPVPNGGYKTILADPPWDIKMSGKRSRKKEGNKSNSLPYNTMELSEIIDLPVAKLASEDAHLWLWTTNQTLEYGFIVMRSWGFNYLAPVHWVKPSGMGNWFIHRTQTILFGYRKSCRFPLGRYKPNIFYSGDPKRHSEKPEESYDLIESISPGPRLELFARKKREGFFAFGNEI